MTTARGSVRVNGEGAVTETRSVLLLPVGGHGGRRRQQWSDPALRSVLNGETICLYGCVL